MTTAVRPALRPVAATPLADSLPVLESFVSPYVGIVRGLVELARATDEARLVGYGALVADPLDPAGQRPTGHSGGSHWLRDAARAAALGESVERYSASYLPVERLVLATAGELGADAVDPESFALFHPRQYAVEAFPFAPFTREARVRWTRGFSLPDGRPVWLPAQLVYLPLPGVNGDETLIGYATSSGVACAPTPEEAILSGLFELIERDAFMLAWTNRLSLPLLDWSGDEQLRTLDERYFAPSGLRYAAVDLGVFFGVPAALGVVHGTPGELGALGVGAGCGPTVAVAWRKALAEAFDVRAHVRDALYEDPSLLGRPAEEIGSFDDHIFFYGDEQRAAAAAFLDASAERRSTLDVAPVPGANVLELIEAVVAALARHGVSAYAADVTSPDVADSGLSVMRVVCPQLCALDVVDRARFLGGRRLYHAAFEAGLVPRPLALADLNPDPHPFP
ncbi:MAG TPA: YcaO-like family protein [Gaiellaceae bacterium]|nr:YcaO-like family protein [Gaiellaceae bacterium]